MDDPPVALAATLALPSLTGLAVEFPAGLGLKGLNAPVFPLIRSAMKFA